MWKTQQRDYIAVYVGLLLNVMKLNGFKNKLKTLQLTLNNAEG